MRRDLITIGEDMVNLAYEARVDATPQSHIEDAERKLFDLAETGRYERGFPRFAQALTTAVDMAAQAYQRDGSLSGLATGLTDLDSRMGGLQPSDLIILAGRPGMGKTALATNIAYNVARAWAGEVRADGHTATVNGGIVGFFSLEMSAEQLATRIIAEQHRHPIEQDTPRRGSMKATSRRSRTFPSSCRACRCTSTRRAAFPSGNLRRAPDGSSGSPGSIFWSSTTSSSCKAQPGALERKPRAGNHRNHHPTQGARQGS